VFQFTLLAGSWLPLAGPTPAGGSELRWTAEVRAVQQASPSVVNIHGEKTMARDAAAVDPTRRVNGMGTGVVIDERGYILTNYHVVEGVRMIEVTFADGETTVGRLVNHDPATDLAVIRIDVPRPLPMIKIGTSSDLMPGEPVLAVGNAYGYQHTVTRGIISALHRPVQVSDAQSYGDLIQTDASINPGNSGGPLLNIDGEMIGLNVAVRAGAQGIGFAIPVDEAMEIAARLLDCRRLDKTWHGFQARTEREGKTPCVVISGVDKDSPADDLGLQKGDRILAIDNRPVERALDVERALLGRKPGDEIPVEFSHEGETLTASLTLAELPLQADATADAVWDVIGLKLKPVASRQFRQVSTKYNGGLTVVSVRPKSPAAQQGIRAGDILVGMHIWETISVDDVLYTLNRPDLAEFNPVKFYILRKGETYSGRLALSTGN
jgi:serine protease Do